MKKTISFVLLLSSSLLDPCASPALASSSEPNYAETCASLGLEKIKSEAEGLGVSLKDGTFEVCGIDNRWYNPSKYVWYCETATAQDGTESKISKLVQFYRGKCN